MWDYMKKQGYDVVLTSALVFCTAIVGANATENKPLQQTSIIIGLMAVDILYIAKAWEAKTAREKLDEYKATVYTTEILTSDVPEYMGDPLEDITHLKEQHQLNKGQGQYKHEVNIYRIDDSTTHVYLTALGLNN